MQLHDIVIHSKQWPPTLKSHPVVPTTLSFAMGKQKATGVRFSQQTAYADRVSTPTGYIRNPPQG